MVILVGGASLQVRAQSCHSATAYKSGPGFAQWLHCTQDHQFVMGGIYYATSGYFSMDGDTVFSPPGAVMTAWVAFVDSSFQLIRLQNGISLYNAGGSFSQASIYDMEVDAYKNIYFTGRYADDTLAIGNDTLFSEGYAEGFLVRYDSLGAVTLLKSFGSRSGSTNYTFDDFGRALAVDPQGNIFVTGTFEGDKFGVNTDSVSNGTFVGLNSYAQAFTFSLNPQGQTRWLKACGTPTQDESPLGIAVDSFGNVSICGQTSADNQVFSFGTYNYLYKDVQFSYQGFVAAYDSLGQEQWLFPLEAYYGGGPDFSAYAVARDESGNTYAMGAMDAWGIFDGDTVKTPNYNSSFLTKINAAGQKQFVKLGNTDTFYPFPGHIFYRAGKVITIGQSYSNQVTFDYLGIAGSALTYVAVYDTSGAIQWLRGGISNGGGGDINFYGVGLDPLGRVYVCGGASGGNVTVDPYVINAQVPSYLLIRFDSIADNGLTMQLTVNGSDTVVCGYSRQIQGISNPSGSMVKYTWWADNDTIALPNFVGANLNASPKFTTTYIASASYNGCVVSDTVVLYSLPLPMDLGSDTSLCFGDTLRFAATIYPGASYAWSPPAGLSNDSVANPLLTAQLTTAYTCQLSAYGCTARDTVLVQVETVPQAGFSFVSNLLSVSFQNNSSGGNKFLWDFGDGTQDTVNANPQHLYLNDSVYTVCLTVFNDCFNDSNCQVINLTGVGSAEQEDGAELLVGDSQEQWVIYQSTALVFDRYELMDVRGKVIFNRELAGPSTVISKAELSAGIYLIKCLGEKKTLVKKIVLHK